MKFPQPIQNLIQEFEKLPGVGPKTAERYVLYLLKKDKQIIWKFAQSLMEIYQKITFCNNCHAPALDNPCQICKDPQRDKQILCIISQYQDLIAIEQTKKFNGQYHILGGSLNALEGITPKTLNIESLIKKIKQQQYKEIILALNPNIEGEVTVMYLKRLLKQFPHIQITRLAQGLPMGGYIEYSDEVTISNALEGRKPL